MPDLLLLKLHTVFLGDDDSSSDIIRLDLWWLFVGYGHRRPDVQKPLFKAAGSVRERQSCWTSGAPRITPVTTSPDTGRERQNAIRGLFPAVRTDEVVDQRYSSPFFNDQNADIAPVIEGLRMIDHLTQENSRIHLFRRFFWIHSENASELIGELMQEVYRDSASQSLHFYKIRKEVSP